MTELPACTDGMCSGSPASESGTADVATSTATDDGMGPSGSATGSTVDGETSTPAMCGDGDLGADELCDDGNLLDGDGCNADCQPSLRILAHTQFDGPAGGRDIARTIGVSDLGQIVFGGSIEDFGGPVGIVRGLDAGLVQVWTETLDFPVTDSSVNDVAVEESGYAAVVGTIGTGDTRRAVAVYYDPEGNPAWSDLVGDGAMADLPAEGEAVALDNFGSIFVGGFAGLTDAEAARITRYVPNGPPEQADDLLPVAKGVNEFVLAMTTRPPSTVVYVGLRVEGGANTGIVGAFPDGGLAPVALGGGAVAQGIATSLAGDQIIVVGSRQAEGVLWAAGYDVDFDPLWTQEFDGAVGTLHDAAVGPDGSYYVVGGVEMGAGTDMFVAHLAANGDLEFSAAHDFNGGNDSGFDIAYDPSDDTLVAAGEQQIAGADFDAFVVRLAR